MIVINEQAEAELVHYIRFNTQTNVGMDLLAFLERCRVKPEAPKEEKVTPEKPAPKKRGQ